MSDRKPFWWVFAIIQAIAWSVGIIVALTVASWVALFLLSKYGSDRYVLECPGKIISKQASGYYDASLYLDVTEYGSIIQLWSDGSGTAQAEIPKDFYAFLTIKNAGTHRSLSNGDKLSGDYSPISQAISLNLGDGREFDGTCSKRKN
ncbi:hypothetical protein N5C16_00480 [Stenotrophomonas sp. GD03908]|uniref:hypothetical protein n=1 Tax=Stenotrophomonas sp. GD03908 TaxID=2975403 RepID=UPI00244778C6|nr:hypothetical protein [Stenotrophomonas sp. GD03908]MDH0977741.1 hypothetical protein [Stenotrophomonas sp. GD03908]